MALDPIKLLNEAREAVPAVNYALALAGLAASASIIIGLIGNSRAAILIVGLVFIGMVLIFLFSSLITANTYSCARGHYFSLGDPPVLFVFFIIYRYGIRSRVSLPLGKDPGVDRAVQR